MEHRFVLMLEDLILINDSEKYSGSYWLHLNLLCDKLDGLFIPLGNIKLCFFCLGRIGLLLSVIETIDFRIENIDFMFAEELKTRVSDLRSN